MKENEIKELYRIFKNKLIVELDEELYFLYTPMRVFREKGEKDSYLAILHFDNKAKDAKIEGLAQDINENHINEDYEIMTSSQIIREINNFLNK